MTTGRLSHIALLLLSGYALSACSHQRHDGLHESSANFDLQDVKPILTRVVALLDSGLTAEDVDTLVRSIARQPIKSDRKYEYSIVAQGSRSPFRIVVHMDVINSPDIYFYTDARLAARIDTMIRRYFAEVGK